MTGSTISTYVTQTVTLGSTTYPSPLTITSTGTINTTSQDGVYAESRLGNVTLINDGNITAVNCGVDLYGAGAYISNFGTITGGSRGIRMLDGGTVSNTGTAASIYGHGMGVEIDHAPGVVTNTGTISGATYYGVLLYGAGGSVTNTGTGAEIFGKKGGVYIINRTGSVSNSGTITATSIGVDLNAGGYIGNQALITGGQEGVQLLGTGTVQNTGTILATGTSGHFLAGVLVDGYDTVNNSGTAALISGVKYGVYSYIPRVLISNDGTITGGTSATGIGIFVNSPFVVGRATVLNTDTAAYIGGGSIGVDVNIDIGTVTNAGTIKGVSDAGVDLAGGGTVSNTGTAATIYGLQAGVTIMGAAGTVFNAGTITGGQGFGISLYNGGYIGNTGTISGADTGAYIDGAGYINNQKIITGNYGVKLNDGGTLVNTGTITCGALATKFSDGGTLVNTGRIISTTNGRSDYAVILKGADGYITNGTAALISGARGGLEIGITVGAVMNQGTIESSSGAGSGIFVAGTAGGTIDNNGTAALISGYDGISFQDGPGTVTNAGTIKGVSDAGVDLAGGGTVSNTGTAAVISGYNGITIEDGPGSVTNTGTIRGVSENGIFLADGGTISNTSTAASIYGRSVGVTALTVSAAVINAGTITSGYSGVYMDAGGSVTNTGTAALVHGGAYGVEVRRAAGSVNNAGTITGTSKDGVYLGAGGTVTNTGIITGTTTTATYRHAGIVIHHAGYVGNTAATALISGEDGVLVTLGLGTVSNMGSISGISGVGVYLQDGGTVTNTGTAATISGAEAGIKILGTAGQVSNTGTISGIGIGVELADGGTLDNNGTTALIYGGQTAVVVATIAGTITNAGTISGQTFAALLEAGGSIDNQNVITGGAFGVAIAGDGTVMNTGSILSTVLGKGGNYAVYITGPDAYITNSGTAALISGADGGIFIKSTLGAVINAGTIESTSGDGTGILVFASSSSDSSFTVQNTGPAAYIAGYDGINIANVVGIVDNTGTIIGAASDGVDLTAGGTVSNTGTASVIDGTGIGVEIGGAAATVTNAGLISGNTDAVYLYATTSNVLIADVGADFVGGVVARTSASGNTLELAQGPAAGPGTLFGIGNQFLGFGTINFDAGTDWTLGGNSNGLASGQVINGFTFGDTIDLAPSIQSLVARRLDSAAITESFANNILTLFSGGVEFATLNLNELTTTNSENFQVFSDGNGGTDIVMDMPCYCTGTKILTPTGEVNVEDIRVGDTVITVLDNGPTTGRVTWTGKRSLDISRHPNQDSMHPIRIIAGAFARGLPERDLRLSPHHALYIDGVLMEAISLVNGATVIQEFDTNFVTYHHIALESHDVILAEGLPAETYLETGHRNMFEGEASLVLHPNFQILGDADFCAPMIRAGAKLEAARAHLLARAELLGFFKTDEIDLAIHPTTHPRHGRA